VIVKYKEILSCLIKLLATAWIFFISTTVWQAEKIFSFDLPKIPSNLRQEDIKKAIDIGGKVVESAKPMSDEEEMTLGRELAANLIARYGLYEEPDIVKYLNLVGKTLARHSSRKNINYRFAVLNSETINAFAAPGGYVFITKGALKIIKDESGLAGVLAHEISHIESRHIPKAIKKSNLVSAGSDLVSVFAKDKEIASKVLGFSTDMLFKGYSRNDEKEADSMAVDLLVRCGYSVNGLKDFINNIKNQKSDDPKFLVLMRTHPNPDDRLKIIDEYMKSKNYSSSLDGVLNRERFEKNLLLAEK